MQDRKYNQNKFKTIRSRAAYFLALLKARLLRMNTPVICVLVVNNRCNLNCKYCFGGYAHRKIPDYSTEELKGLIAQLHKMGTRYLNIHGGETLLRKDIGEIVNYIKSKGIYCCLITNGILLPERINEIRAADNITISLDGGEENNDKNRGKGNFAKVMRAIKLCIKENVPLRISATLTKYTMNDIGYMARLAKDMRFTLYYSILFKPLEQAKDCAMTHEEIQTAMNKIIEYKKAGFPIFTSCRAAEYARDWPLDHNEYHFLKKADMAKLPKGFKHIQCYYGKIKFTIEADGNVYPCFLLGGNAKNFEPLNWREAGIKKAIEHVQETNDCVTCPALSQNDHSLLLGLHPGQIKNVILDQIKEGFRRK